MVVNKTCHLLQVLATLFLKALVSSCSYNFVTTAKLGCSCAQKIKHCTAHMFIKTIQPHNINQQYTGQKGSILIGSCRISLCSICCIITNVLKSPNQYETHISQVFFLSDSCAYLSLKSAQRLNDCL